MIHGAAIGNREQVLQSSIKLGFLTGFEDKVSCCTLVVIKNGCHELNLLCHNVSWT